MQETIPDPRAEQGQEMARTTAKKLCQEMRAYIKDHPPKGKDPVRYPNDGYGKWILRFLNTELALHGWSATLVWEGDDHVFLLHKLSRATSPVHEQEGNPIPHFWLIVFLIILFGWMFEVVFVPVVN
jgi:hypothetical protein